MGTTPLFTKVELGQPGFGIRYDDSLIFLGSCFASNVGQRLLRLKYPTTINPFGVLYNPASVSSAILRLLSKKEYTADELAFHHNTWLSFDHYTRFSNKDKSIALETINASFRQGADALQKASVLFLTFGTSYVFRLKKNHKLVANCHKVPAGEFNRELLSVSDIVHVISDAVFHLEEMNPNLRIVTTISPIRHWKDGATGNLRSKARLVLALEEIQRQFPSVYYFPVYELFMDEFRDYRFYADDMLHPSTFAIQRVWEYFVDTFFDPNELAYHKPIEKLQRMLEHRISTTDTVEIAEFKQKILLKIKELNKQMPFIDWENELRTLD